MLSPRRCEARTPPASGTPPFSREAESTTPATRRRTFSASRASSPHRHLTSSSRGARRESKNKAPVQRLRSFARDHRTPPIHPPTSHDVAERRLQAANVRYVDHGIAHGGCYRVPSRLHRRGTGTAKRAPAQTRGKVLKAQKRSPLRARVPSKSSPPAIMERSLPSKSSNQNAPLLIEILPTTP